MKSPKKPPSDRARNAIRTLSGGENTGLPPSTAPTNASAGLTEEDELLPRNTKEKLLAQCHIAGINAEELRWAVIDKSILDPEQIRQAHLLIKATNVIIESILEKNEC